MISRRSGLKFKFQLSNILPKFRTDHFRNSENDVVQNRPMKTGEKNALNQPSFCYGESDFAAIWHMDATWDCESPPKLLKYTSGQMQDGRRRLNCARIKTVT